MCFSLKIYFFFYKSVLNFSPLINFCQFYVFFLVFTLILRIIYIINKWLHNAQLIHHIFLFFILHSIMRSSTYLTYDSFFFIFCYHLICMHFIHFTCIIVDFRFYLLIYYFLLSFVYSVIIWYFNAVFCYFFVL